MNPNNEKDRGTSSNVPPGDKNQEASENSAQQETEIIKRFDSAAYNFIQAVATAEDATNANCVGNRLDYEKAIREHEYETQIAIMEANKKSVERLGELSANTNPQECWSLQRKVQSEYEQEVRLIYANAQNKAQAIALQMINDRGEAQANQYAEQKRGAYEKYLQEIKAAWAKLEHCEPATLAAVASSMLAVVNRIH